MQKDFVSDTKIENSNTADVDANDVDNLREILAINIANCRQSKKLTQAELARLVGVTPAAIGQYEAKRRTPQIEVLARMAQVFDISVDRLISSPIPNQNCKSSLELRTELATLIFEQAGWNVSFVNEGVILKKTYVPKKDNFPDFENKITEATYHFESKRDFIWFFEWIQHFAFINLKPDLVKVLANAAMKKVHERALKDPVKKNKK